jgi:TetR/AcrR family transcriptional repressor of nem operon
MSYADVRYSRSARIRQKTGPVRTMHDHTSYCRKNSGITNVILTYALRRRTQSKNPSPDREERFPSTAKKGLNGPAVATLVKASGLTHGGFYKHFSSRDDLVVEAIEESLMELTKTLIDAAKDSGSRDAWKAMVTTYLSLQRCDGADIGCPIAALAPDIARTAPAMKQGTSAAILKFRSELIPFMPGRTTEEKSSNFLMLMTSMVGTIALARRMLEAVREEISIQSEIDSLQASSWSARKSKFSVLLSTDQIDANCARA